MQTHARKSQGSVMVIMFKLEIASPANLVLILYLENALIKIVSAMAPMNYVAHVEMDSKLMQMEIVNSRIPIVSPLSMEDVMFVPKAGIQMLEEIVSGFQPIVSSGTLSLRDPAPNV